MWGRGERLAGNGEHGGVGKVEVSKLVRQAGRPGDVTVPVAVGMGQPHNTLSTFPAVPSNIHPQAYSFNNPPFIPTPYITSFFFFIGLGLLWQIETECLDVRLLCSLEIFVLLCPPCGGGVGPAWAVYVASLSLPVCACSHSPVCLHPCKNLIPFSYISFF